MTSVVLDALCKAWRFVIEDWIMDPRLMLLESTVMMENEHICLRIDVLASSVHNLRVE